MDRVRFAVAAQSGCGEDRAGRAVAAGNEDEWIAQRLQMGGALEQTTLRAAKEEWKELKKIRHLSDLHNCGSPEQR